SQLNRLEVSFMPHLEGEFIPQRFEKDPLKPYFAFFPSLRALNLSGTQVTVFGFYKFVRRCLISGQAPELESLNLDNAINIPFSVPFYRSVTIGTNAMFTL